MQSDSPDQHEVGAIAGAASGGRGSATAVPARSAALDVLRAVAIFLVIGRHALEPNQDWSAPAKALLAVWKRGGWIGVDLFFVLSGFLISGLLFREYQRYRSVHVGRFLLRRGLKIYPAFYTFLAISVVALVFRSRPVPARAVLFEALFVQNYGQALFPHTWSLAVEEHFYLLCALAIWLVVRRSGVGADPYRRVPTVFFAVAALSLAARLATAFLLPYANKPHLFSTHLRLDGLMFGVCLSYLYWFRRPAVAAWVKGREAYLLALGGALLLPAFALQLETTFFVYTFGLTAFYLGSGLILMPLVLDGLGHSLGVRTLAWVGSRSYSIYLWHIQMRGAAGWLCTNVLHASAQSPLAFVLYALAAVLGGALMAWLVELPVLRLRDRFFPSRSL